MLPLLNKFKSKCYKFSMIFRKELTWNHCGVHFIDLHEIGISLENKLSFCTNKYLDESLSFQSIHIQDQCKLDSKPGIFHLLEKRLKSIQNIKLKKHISCTRQNNSTTVQINEWKNVYSESYKTMHGSQCLYKNST